MKPYVLICLSFFCLTACAFQTESTPQTVQSNELVPLETSLTAPEDFSVQILDGYGQLEAIAGTGKRGFMDGQASIAQFNHVSNLCFDPTDKGLFLIEGGRIRKWSHNSQIVTLAAINSLYTEQIPVNLGKNKSGLIGCSLDLNGGLYFFHDRNLKYLSPKLELKTIISSKSKNFHDGKLEEASLESPVSIQVNKSSGKIYISDKFRLRVIENDQIKTLNTNQEGTAMRPNIETDISIKDVNFSNSLHLFLNSSGELYISDLDLKQILVYHDNKVKIFANSSKTNEVIEGHHPWLFPTQISSLKDRLILAAYELYELQKNQSIPVFFSYFSEPPYYKQPDLPEKKSFSALATDYNNTIYLMEANQPQLLRMKVDI